MYVSSDESSEEGEEDKEELSEYNNNEYKSDNSGNSKVWSKSLSTFPDVISCGVESYDSNGINHDSSTNNIELCNCDDSDCDCDGLIQWI